MSFVCLLALAGLLAVRVLATPEWYGRPHRPHHHHHHHHHGDSSDGSGDDNCVKYLRPCCTPTSTPLANGDFEDTSGALQNWTADPLDHVIIAISPTYENGTGTYHSVQFQLDEFTTDATITQSGISICPNLQYALNFWIAYDNYTGASNCQIEVDVANQVVYRHGLPYQNSIGATVAVQAVLQGIDRMGDFVVEASCRNLTGSVQANIYVDGFSFEPIV